MLGDTETKVASRRKVPLPQLVLLDLEPSLEDLLGLGPTDGDMHGDLFVSVTRDEWKIGQLASGFSSHNNSLPISRSEKR